MLLLHFFPELPFAKLINSVYGFISNNFEEKKRASDHLRIKKHIDITKLYLEVFVLYYTVLIGNCRMSIPNNRLIECKENYYFCEHFDWRL